MVASLRHPRLNLSHHPARIDAGQPSLLRFIWGPFVEFSDMKKRALQRLAGMFACEPLLLDNAAPCRQETLADNEPSL